MKRITIYAVILIIELCLFCLVSLLGCGDSWGWGKIMNVRTVDKIKPYAGKGPMMTLSSKGPQIFLSIADYMGTQALDAATFAQRGASVFDDDRCKYAAEECKKAQAYQNSIFVIVSISQKSGNANWPAKYVLEVTDSQKNKTSYVAIQPIVEQPSYSHDEVGFCTRLEGVNEFSLLFIVPKNIAQNMARLALKSPDGTIKWRKEAEPEKTHIQGEKTNELLQKNQSNTPYSQEEKTQKKIDEKSLAERNVSDQPDHGVKGGGGRKANPRINQVNYEKIKVGMTLNQVLDILGPAETDNMIRPTPGAGYLVWDPYNDSQKGDVSIMVHFHAQNKKVTGKTWKKTWKVTGKSWMKKVETFKSP